MRELGIGVDRPDESEVMRLIAESKRGRETTNRLKTNWVTGYRHLHRNDLPDFNSVFCDLDEDIDAFELCVATANDDVILARLVSVDFDDLAVQDGLSGDRHDLQFDFGVYLIPNVVVAVQNHLDHRTVHD